MDVATKSFRVGHTKSPQSVMSGGAPVSCLRMTDLSNFVLLSLPLVFCETLSLQS